MKGKGSPEFFAFAKKGILWLLILIFYFLGLLSYGRIQNSESVPVYFSSSYPDGNRVREILEREKEGKIQEDCVSTGMEEVQSFWTPCRVERQRRF